VSLRRLAARSAIGLATAFVVVAIVAWAAANAWVIVLVSVTVAGAAVGSRLAGQGASSRGLTAVAGALPGLAALACLGAFLNSAEAFGAVVTHGSTQGNEVALTFDDGPNPTYTPQVLAILDDAGVKGTFFEVGRAVEANPQVAKALVDSGHLLGNHSYTHGRWIWLSPTYPELARDETAIRDKLGLCPAFFRPPHGIKTPQALYAAGSRGMETVLWSVSSDDWKTDDPQRVIDRVLSQVRGGSIVLFHDGLNGDPTADRSVLVQALPRIIEDCARAAYSPCAWTNCCTLPAT
jgi:peptidoglycan/xylan/chitin deacetylase (PgdA/CDA1 family)